jgi:anthranilate phosphoribosyltransferase
LPTESPCSRSLPVAARLDCFTVKLDGFPPFRHKENGDTFRKALPNSRCSAKKVTVPSVATLSSSHSSHPEVVTTFLRTRAPASEQDYFSALSALRPDHLTTSEIAAIVDWVQTNKKRISTVHPHVNVFGTGGDKTINVTSLACSIASRFIPIVKVGTPAVLSNFGSSDFFSFFRTHPRYIPEQADASFPFAFGSHYFPLSDFGFPYNATLRKARRRLFKNAIPDLYKIVFPFANYTDPSIQINGASSALYFSIFTDLCRHFNRNACVVRSLHDFDELIPGDNVLYIHTSAVKEHINLHLPNATWSQLKTILSETSAPSQSPTLLLSLLAGKADPLLKQIVAWNAALYVTCLRQIQNAKPPFKEQIEANFLEIVNSL